ncbi:MAG: type II secretion system protein GspM [Nitrospirae bacterium]|nr:type II secretion system protein GspM [Nitrospirota bacterium]MCL5237665.1 type II secretion system protein GspM [Nitrospirota bacterium]
MPKNKMLLFLMPVMALLLIAVVYQYGYRGVQAEVASLKEAQNAKIKTLTKYMAFIAEKAGMEKKLASLKEARKAGDSKLFEGKTLSIATASLQETVKGIVTGRGGKIISERVGKPEDFGKFTVITASIDATLPDTRALGDILNSIETRTPYLVVKELDVRVRTFKDPRELSVKLDVSALTGGRK